MLKREKQEPAVQDTLEKCTGCNKCVQNCNFLKKYGNPGELARVYFDNRTGCYDLAYRCNLCSLCSSKCREGVNPSHMFLSVRREACLNGHNLTDYKSLLSYESKGYSKRFSLYMIPEGCDTVFFPGCALAGTRSGTTKKTFLNMSTKIKRLGIVLDCCTKPSHDLGKQDFFLSKFTKMATFLKEKGVKNIITACPNCFRIFSDYGGEFNTKTAYEVLLENTDIKNSIKGNVTIHDPCVVRFEDKIHRAVRGLVKKYGLDVTEMIHSKRNTFCCGEGGAVGAIDPKLAGSWSDKRCEEALNKTTITYCAGCSGKLTGLNTVHILDLIADPKKSIKGKMKATKSPFTYFKRLLLKQQIINENKTRECTIDAREFKK